MRTSSLKAKGRRACAEAREEFLSALKLHPDDILVTSSGATGEDLKLSPHARQALPFVFEVKNQEALNIWDAYKQAEGHWEKCSYKEEVYPAVIYRRNRSDLMISMSLEDFIHFCFTRYRNVLPKEKERTPENEGIHLP